MRVRCRATAHVRGNSVGDLELECRGAGLLISYVGVSSYREGYAPGFQTRGTVVHAPWQTTRGIRLGDENLLLCVDADVTPLNRFLLGNFSHAEPARSGWLRRRLNAMLALAALVVFGCGAAWVVLPKAALHADAVFRFSSIGAILLLLGGALIQRLTKNGPGSRAVLRDFVRKLSEHLPEPLPVEPPLPRARSWSVQRLSVLLPRSAVGGLIALSALALAALLGGRAAPAASHVLYAPTTSERTQLADSASLPAAPSPRDPAADALPTGGAQTLRPLPEALEGSPP
jgi:hypothetical protein